MAAPDACSAAGLCTRCGMRGRHDTPERCIRVLRERLACMELLMAGQHGEYLRAKRRISEGRRLRLALIKG